MAIDKDIGPFKYVAELIYGDSMDGNLDRAVRLVIICLILVFDPLAVLMLIAFNVSIREKELRNGTFTPTEIPFGNWQAKTENTAVN